MRLDLRLEAVGRSGSSIARDPGQRGQRCPRGGRRSAGGGSVQQLMRLLLDTQVMLWWHLDDPRLGKMTRALLAVRPCLVSVVSIWKVAIKHRLGKLALKPVAFCDQSFAACAALLPVFDTYAIETAQLPLVHHVSFDRLLIAQARVEGVMAVSSDGQWPGDGVSLNRV